MVDMYKLAQDQAKSVDKMVELLTSIEKGLKTIADNQVETYLKLEQIEERLEIIEAQGGIEDDMVFAEDLFNDNDYDGGCDCPLCYEDEDDELPDDKFTPEELEAIANDDLNMLVSSNQLPYRFYGSTVYEYVPETSKPITIEVNTVKRTVVAMMKDTNGKVVKVGKARCAPDDVFSPLVGAAIATYRLFEVEIPEYYL
jgi:hypothetical protein